MGPGYTSWTHEQLVARIAELEAQLLESTKITTTSVVEPLTASADDQNQSPSCKPQKQQPKAFDPSKYSTRLIALKFAYLGQRYNGFEHHNKNTTPLPTIEEELWKALVKTRLISPPPKNGGVAYGRVDRKTLEAWGRGGADVNWDGCDYSKCGRTDRGVSAFGQVIGVRVRSHRPLPASKTLTTMLPSYGAEEETDEPSSSLLTTEDVVDEPTKPFDNLKDELPYVQILNRVLPPDIRIYAWCPNPPPNFSARFSCKERRYKYFFTNPCFAPPPSGPGLYTTAPDQTTMREGWLDIDKMRAACRELIGLHDFRNFCKIDASKQLTNFKRRIFHADIEEISPLSVPSFLSHPAIQNPALGEQPKMYAFVLHGSAFLWHQVRSIVAILFLIGQGLESPSLVPQLLNVSTNPTRPKYEMASDAPLVLWDCIFPHASEVQSADEREHGYKDRLDWVYVGDEGAIESTSRGKAKAGGLGSMGNGKWGRGGVIDDVWETWRGNKIDETLSALLLDTVVSRGTSTLDAEEKEGPEGWTIGKGGPRVFDGGNMGRAKGNYIPVLERERQDPVEIINERYARRKGLDANKIKPNSELADE